ncbi:hypothetical protein [Gemella cuniculi]
MLKYVKDMRRTISTVGNQKRLIYSDSLSAYGMVHKLGDVSYSD